MFGILKTYRFLKATIFGQLNGIKTILFNFRMLPFHEAKHLPIFLYGKVDISQCTGRIEFENNDNLHHGQWSIGNTYSTVYGQNTCYNTTYLAIQGIMKLGHDGHISNGCRISVFKNAVLSFGRGILINPDSIISTYKRIEFGDDCRVSWQCQIYDTNFHFMISDNAMVLRRTEPVYIGKEVWIGHNVTIGKGAALGDGCILAAHSLLNKNYINEKNCIFAGCPAEKKKDGYRRILSENCEAAIEEFFENNPTKNSCKFDIDTMSCE